MKAYQDGKWKEIPENWDEKINEAERKKDERIIPEISANIEWKERKVNEMKAEKLLHTIGKWKYKNQTIFTSPCKKSSTETYGNPLFKDYHYEILLRNHHLDIHL